MTRSIRGILLLALLVASCHDSRPPTPTAEQSAELNDAERMLNDMARNEEGPEQKAPALQNQPAD